MNTLPEKPKEEDCCGSECNPCIFGVYEQKMQQFKKGNLSTGPAILNDLKYTPFILSHIKQITENINLYTFQAVNPQFERISQAINLKMGDYIILKGNTSAESISRPYTPILSDALFTGSFQVIIRLYDNGVMSKIIKNYKIGDATYWRGPYNHLKLKKTKHLVLLGAGTGVVPLYNIAKELVEDEVCETLITLIACYNNTSSILLRDELQSLNNYWNFKSEYYLASADGFIGRYNERMYSGKLDAEIFRSKLINFDLLDLFLVICGSETFNEVFKNVAFKSGLGSDNLQVL